MANKKYTTGKSIIMLLNTILNQFNNGEISEEKMRALAYVASIQLKALEVGRYEMEFKEMKKDILEMKKEGKNY